MRQSPFVLLLMLAACASDRDAHERDVPWLVRHGRFADAVRVADEQARANPDDAALQIQHRDASVAYLLENGRRATFDDLDVEALEFFERAAELDPESAVAREWVEKTNAKLATRWLENALELHANDDLEPALEAYDMALSYVPAEKGALTGRALALLLLNYRKGLGRDYFQAGLHAYSDYWLERARSSFSYSVKYLPSDERAQDRRGKVEELLAGQRMVQGQKFEEEGRYGAARNEYRIALQLDPNSEEARAAVERCRVEMEVSQELKMVGMDLVRGRFDAAAKRIEKTHGKPHHQQEAVQKALGELREARLDKAYNEALALERDHRYQDAITRYTQILTTAEYFEDVIARRDTLREYIRLAAELYAKAAAAPTPDERAGFLRQIEVFWPEYADVRAQLDAHEAQAAPQGG